MNNTVATVHQQPTLLTPQDEFAIFLVTQAGRRYLQKIDRTQPPLQTYFDVGGLLQLVEDQVGHYGFDAAFPSWFAAKLVPFSLKSARRYMLIAPYAADIAAAGITRLWDAEVYACRRSIALGEAEQQFRKPSSAYLPKPAVDLEIQFMDAVFQLPRSMRLLYLKQLVAKTGDLLRV